MSTSTKVLAGVCFLVIVISLTTIGWWVGSLRAHPPVCEMPASRAWEPTDLAGCTQWCTEQTERTDQWRVRGTVTPTIINGRCRCAVEAPGPYGTEPPQ